MKWLPTAGITVLRFKIKTLTGRHELTGKKGKKHKGMTQKSLKQRNLSTMRRSGRSLAHADANKDNVS